ncbi:MAG TPA: iron dicitrate transport regulator FecR, partial [Pirellulaceae bacterium]|nr:iron dicitrate transport regulator FecR [Pirellulaceae bacterium]
TAKYYRVIPRGFREDCRSYVDRDHEWNGLDERGLPPFMVGGDYVMTFNDDKIVTEIEIAVTLSQPATLYVLLDDRVEPPEWLKRDFVDTNWDVGSDDGWPDGDISTGIGPGVSIDHVCSVWKRDVYESTTVVLGSLS